MKRRKFIIKASKIFVGAFFVLRCVPKTLTRKLKSETELFRLRAELEKTENNELYRYKLMQYLKKRDSLCKHIN